MTEGQDGSVPGPNEAPTPAPRSTRLRSPRWHRLYFALAAFDVLTVCISLAINHRLIELHGDALARNHFWADQIAALDAVRRNAEECNAPGNEVFETGATDDARIALERSLGEFSRSIESVRGTIVAAIGAEGGRREEMERHLDLAEAHMAVQAHEATSIFDLFERGDRPAAGGRMAAMDRASYAVSAEIDAIASEVRRLQFDEFEREQALTTSMQRLEYLVGGMIVAMVLGLTLYGHRVSKAVKRDHEKLQTASAALDATLDAVFLIDQAAQRFTYVNRAGQEQTGYTLEELLEMPPSRVHSEFASEAIQAWFSGEGASADDAVSFESWIETRAGERAAIEATIQYVPELDRFLAVVRDIRDRKAAQRMLDLHKRALDEHAIVAMTDARGKITYANDKFCEISGYGREELLGQDHRMVNSGTHPRGFFSEMYRTVAHGRTWRAEVCNRRKSGTQYWVDTSIVGIEDDEGDLAGYFAIRTDITERKRTEEALEQALRNAEAANEMKSSFLANMSHEIRTPMTAILGFTEMLLEAEVDDFEGVVRTIHRNGEHLLTIINDVLDLSKIESGRLEIERIEMDPVAVFHDTIALLRGRAEGKGVGLELEQATPMPRTLVCDPVRVRQILVNLVGNAIKFTERGYVRVVMRWNEEECLLEADVIDSGIGMSESQLEGLFQPFVQADVSMTRRFGGTGLGLTISRRFAQALGGDINVRSTLGEGSTFTMSVQASAPSGSVPADASITELPVPPPTAPAGPLTGRVLLAEDGPDNQRLVSHLLRKMGLEVTVAENGQVACELVRTAEEARAGFDLVLMDMQMPVMDGYTATATLRAEGFALPIVALTAHAMTSERQKCLDAGCDEFTSKPIRRPEFHAIVATMLQRDRPIRTTA